MLELKSGEVYTAARANSGSNDRGIWQFAAVKEEKKGGKTILVWVANKPQQLEAGGNFRLKTIHAVKFTSRKDPAGQWHDECQLTADIEPVMSYADVVNNGIDVSTSTFDDLDGGDGELPF